MSFKWLCRIERKRLWAAVCDDLLNRGRKCAANGKFMRRLDLFSSWIEKCAAQYLLGWYYSWRPNYIRCLNDNYWFDGAGTLNPIYSKLFNLANFTSIKMCSMLSHNTSTHLYAVLSSMRAQRQLDCVSRLRLNLLKINYADASRCRATPCMPVTIRRCYYYFYDLMPSTHI